MYLSILILPLIGGILGVNRFCGAVFGPIISTSCIFFTAILSTFVFFEVGFGESPVYLQFGYWFQGPFSVEWTLVFDSLTVSMLIPVIYVSSLVQMYSLSYMHGDPHRSRFFSYLSLFSFAMILLITAENLLLLFVGWECVGLVSYLLVNFYFTRIAANHSSLKAFLINRIGDMALSLGLFFTIAFIGDLSLATLFSTVSYLNGDLLFFLVLALILGACAKSGQVGLHTWLPSAMEGCSS